MDASTSAVAPSPESVARFLTGRGPTRAVEAVGAPRAANPGRGSGEGDVRAAVEDVKAFAGARAHALEFSIDEPTGETVITVRERDSGEVIRQIPAEEILAVAARIREMQDSGLLMQDKA